MTRLIHWYRRNLSQYTPSCPSSPSCSEYGLLVVGRYGAVRGGWMAVRRVWKCR